MMNEPHMAETSTDHPATIHGFRVLAKLGDGAASRLFVVSDPETRQILALKHVRAEDSRDRRFLVQAEREHLVGSRVSSSLVRASRRLIRYRELVRTTEIALILDFIDGEPLDRPGHLPLWEQVSIFADVAAGLAHLHDLGWAHADLKPGNIIRTGLGRGTIIDLGQAARLGETKPRIQGTPGFLAPEQLERGAIDSRTDAFLLGATIYKRLTGRYAAGGISGPMSHKPLRRLVASAPVALEALVERCLDPHPGRRPHQMDQVSLELRECAAGLQEMDGAALPLAV